MNRDEFVFTFKLLSRSQRRTVCCAVKTGGVLRVYSWDSVFIELLRNSDLSVAMLSSIGSRDTSTIVDQYYSDRRPVGDGGPL